MAPERSGSIALGVGAYNSYYGAEDSGFSAAKYLHVVTGLYLRATLLEYNHDRWAVIPDCPYLAEYSAARFW